MGFVPDIFAGQRPGCSYAERIVMLAFGQVIAYQCKHKTQHWHYPHVYVKSVRVKCEDYCYNQRTYEKKSNFIQRAENNIRFAIDKDPNNANYYAALASLKGMHQDNYEEAFDNIKKAVEMNPSNADYLMLLARIQYSRGNYNEAVAAYRKILNLPVENNVKETVLKNIEQIIGQRN